MKKILKKIRPIIGWLLGLSIWLFFSCQQVKKDGPIALVVTVSWLIFFPLSFRAIKEMKNYKKEKEIKYCPECGAAMPKDNEFCTECGYKTKVE